MNLMVLIPTLGRETLNVIVKQILTDAKSASLHVTIYVGLNGILDSNVQLPQNVRLLNISDTPIGVSECVNIALSMIPPGFLWTIADDDEWLLGKFSCDLKFLTKLERSNSVLLPRIILNDSVGKAIRPKLTIENQNVRDYLYGHISLKRNRRYVTMSGACAHTTFWTRVKFPTMPVREDIVYLIEQEKMGTRFVQPKRPTVQINIDFKRGLARDMDINAALEWQRTFLNRQHAIGFLGCAWPKPFAASGQPHQINKMQKQITREILEDLGLLTLISVKLLLVYWIVIAKIIQRKLK